MWLEKNKDLEKKIFSELGVVHHEMLFGGLINSLYKIILDSGVSGVLKITDNKKEKWMSKKERSILARLDADYFPKILMYGFIDNMEINYNLLTFLEGERLNFSKQNINKNIFFELGFVLAKIHHESKKNLDFYLIMIRLVQIQEFIIHFQDHTMMILNNIIFLQKDGLNI